MPSHKLSELLVDPGPMAAAEGEGLEALRTRLAKRPGARLRTIPLTTSAVLLDLGPESGSPALARTRPTRAGDEKGPRWAWIARGLGRPEVNLGLAPALARAQAELDNDDGDLLSKDDTAVANVLSDFTIEAPYLVEHAVTPLSYRIYPDTPVSEVVQLMLRRGLRAVPVVGKELEVLGVITAGDLLPYALPDASEGSEGAEEGPRMARDVMTRSVLCVSEEQTLLEASRAMLGRDVGQLPVVREGELIGFLDRLTIMRAFAEAIDLPRPGKPGG